MSDHALLGLFILIAVALGLGVGVFLWLQLREAQRLTRAVGALVIQETDKIRAWMRP